MRQLIICTLALVVASGTLHAKGSTPKQRDINKLLQLTGAGKIGMQVMQSVVAQFRQSPAFTKVPAGFWTAFAKESNPDELVQLIVPIYDQHLSHGEIKQLIKFYQSPVGAKLARVMPAMTQQSMVVGQTWGRQLAQRALTKLKEKGYK